MDFNPYIVIPVGLVIFALVIFLALLHGLNP
jgi:hypothetical protein